jgi:hypothetical protein
MHSFCFTFRPRLHVGEFMKICHPRNIEVYEIREMSFQEHRMCEGLESRTCEAPKSRACEGLESRTCEAPKSQTCEGLESLTCEAPNSRTCEGLESRTCEASKSRTRKDPKSWTCEIMNRESAKFGNLLVVKFRSHGARRFLNEEIREPVRSKVKDVVSKSPDLVCELVAGL